MGVITDVVDSIFGGNSANKAAKISAGGADQMAQIIQDQYNTSRNDLAPWRTVGKSALDELAAATGIPNSSGVVSPSPDYSSFYKSPDYNFAFDQGQKALEGSLAARGLSKSGAALKELTGFGQGMASQYLNNYLNRLANIAGLGQTATNTTSALGANAATNSGQAIANAADATASGYLAKRQGQLGAFNAIANPFSSGGGSSLMQLAQMFM